MDLIILSNYKLTTPLTVNALANLPGDFLYSLALVTSNSSNRPDVPRGFQMNAHRESYYKLLYSHGKKTGDIKVTDNSTSLPLHFGFSTIPKR